MALQGKSRLTGPLLLSCLLCCVIVDYTFYRETNSSLLAWFWASLSGVVRNFSVSSLFSRETLWLLAVIVGVGIVLTRLSLHRALQAMRVNAPDAPAVTPVVQQAAVPVTRLLERKSLGTVLIAADWDDTSGFSQLVYERLNKRFPGRVPVEVVKLINEQDSQALLDDWFLAGLDAFTIEQVLAALKR